MARNSYRLDERVSAFLGVRGDTPALLGKFLSALVSSWGRRMDRFAPSLIRSADPLFTGGDLLLGNRSTDFYVLSERVIGGPSRVFGMARLAAICLRALGLVDCDRVDRYRRLASLG